MQNFVVNSHGILNLLNRGKMVNFICQRSRNPVFTVHSRIKIKLDTASQTERTPSMVLLL